jgi:hypothetical protein
VAGLLGGALLSGLIAGILGGVVAAAPDVLRWALLLPPAGLVLAFELAGRPLSLPQNRRAVPQTVIPRSHISGPLQFGFEMGTGVRTYMPTALPHLLALVVILVGGIGPGLAAGFGFGTGRALMPLVRAWHGDHRRWDDRLLAALRAIGRLCAVAFAVLLLLLAVYRWRGSPW